jgi:NAD(P)-dependent dehydrogenase (short-subunit alcohol dehydrogenase family)
LKRVKDCPYGEVALVTGGSSGIGAAIAEGLLERGFRVYATSRRGDGSVRTGAAGGFLKMIAMDVDDDASVARAVASVLAEEGRIGVLVCNAGFGIAGAVEDTSIDEAKAQMETNFFGTFRAVRAVLPSMRREGRGLVVAVGSVAGYISLPFQALYSSSKAASDALLQAVASEMGPYGVRCVMVQPGDTNTGFTDARIVCRSAASPESPYQARFLASVSRMEKDERGGALPAKVAAPVLRQVFRRNPAPKVTPGLMYKLIGFGFRFVPFRTARYLVGLLYG